MCLETIDLELNTYFKPTSIHIVYNINMNMPSNLIHIDKNSSHRKFNRKYTNYIIVEGYTYAIQKRSVTLKKRASINLQINADKLIEI